jgi:hypothetical protein
MRGTMLVSSIENLRLLGHYERYLSLLPVQHSDTLVYAIATSWVPMEVALAHYAACDALELEEPERQRLGELMAERVASTFLAAMLRGSRSVGVDGFWFALGQNDRLYDRMYQGGGVRVIQTGPKDATLENHGLPLVQSRHFRSAYVAYMAALVRLFAKIAYVQQVHPSQPHPHSIAVAGSWV